MHGVECGCGAEGVSGKAGAATAKTRAGGWWRVLIVAFVAAAGATMQAAAQPADSPPSGAVRSVATPPTPRSIQAQLDEIEVLRAPRPPGSASTALPPSSPQMDERPSKAPPLALILPARTTAYGAAAQAVRAGFLAAATAAQAQDGCVVIEHDETGVVDAFAQAARDGAQVMIGPLVRDDLRALLKTPPRLPTIALTRFEDDEAALPPNVFPLTLTVESDARFLARELFIEGNGMPVVVSSETPLMKRFTDAFIDEWLRLGEMPPPRVPFETAAVAALKPRLEALKPSAVLLAVEGDAAALARAQTKAWPTYASGHIYQRQEQFGGFAFDQMRVAEIPWFVTPTAERFKALPPLPPSPAIARLYALGYDAFHVASAFIGGVPLSFNTEGASGSIRFSPKEGLQRSGQLAVFEGGHLLPVEAARP